VAFSVCNHKDNFNSDLGKLKAISRLHSPNISMVLKRDVNDIVINSGIIADLHKYRAADEYFMIDSYVAGALGDLAEMTKTTAVAKA